MKTLALTLTTLALAVPEAVAATHGIHASPNPVKAGKTVRLYGSAAGGCARGDAVTIYSNALKGATKQQFAGIPAVFATAGRHGAFSRRVTLAAKLKAGKYHVGARCGGGNLGAATLTVVS